MFIAPALFVSNPSVKTRFSKTMPAAFKLNILHELAVNVESALGLALLPPLIFRFAMFTDIGVEPV